jgi:hypothetical protein
VLQLGLIPSHFNFRFLQIMHASRFGLGTLELPPVGASMEMWSPSASLSAPGSETMMVSGGVSEDVDMAGNGSKKSGGFGPPWEPAGSYTIDMRWIAQLRRF